MILEIQRNNVGHNLGSQSYSFVQWTKAPWLQQNGVGGGDHREREISNLQQL